MDDFTENPEWRELLSHLASAYNYTQNILAVASAKNEKCTAFNVLCRIDNAITTIKRAKYRNRKTRVTC